MGAFIASSRKHALYSLFIVNKSTTEEICVAIFIKHANCANLGSYYTMINYTHFTSLEAKMVNKVGFLALCFGSTCPLMRKKSSLLEMLLRF